MKTMMEATPVTNTNERRVRRVAGFVFCLGLLAACGDSEATMDGAGGAIPQPPDNAAVGPFTFERLVDNCLNSADPLGGFTGRGAETVWPFDCNITPGVTDARLFDGDCVCQDVWMHEPTGLFACQSLPSSCGGASIFDVAGFPLPAPLWEGVELYPDECCVSENSSPRTCTDAAALADAEAVIPGCATDWGDSCALALHLSGPPTICPSPHLNMDFKNEALDEYFNYLWPREIGTAILWWLEPTPFGRWTLGYSPAGPDFKTLTFAWVPGSGACPTCVDQYRVCHDQLTNQVDLRIRDQSQSSNIWTSAECQWRVHFDPIGPGVREGDFRIEAIRMQNRDHLETEGEDFGYLTCLRSDWCSLLDLAGAANGQGDWTWRLSGLTSPR